MYLRDAGKLYGKAKRATLSSTDPSQSWALFARTHQVVPTAALAGTATMTETAATSLSAGAAGLKSRLSPKGRPSTAGCVTGLLPTSDHFDGPGDRENWRILDLLRADREGTCVFL